MNGNIGKFTCPGPSLDSAMEATMTTKCPVEIDPAQLEGITSEAEMEAALGKMMAVNSSHILVF